MQICTSALLKLQGLHSQLSFIHRPLASGGPPGWWHSLSASIHGAAVSSLITGSCHDKILLQVCLEPGHPSWKSGMHGEPQRIGQPSPASSQASAMTASCCSSVSRLAIRSSVSSLSSSPLRWAIAARQLHSSISLPQDPSDELNSRNIEKSSASSNHSSLLLCSPISASGMLTSMSLQIATTQESPFASHFVFLFARLRDVAEESSLACVVLLEQRAQGRALYRAVLC